MKHSVTQYYEHPLEATRNELKPQLFRVSLQSSEFGAPRIDPGLFLSLSLSLSLIVIIIRFRLSLWPFLVLRMYIPYYYMRERERDGEMERGREATPSVLAVDGARAFILFYLKR